MVPDVLTPAQWRQRREAHERRVDDWVASHVARTRDGVKHPVEDFLFTYYFYRPAQLRRWHPGLGVGLAGAAPDELGPGYAHRDGVLALDPAPLQRRREQVEQLHLLLTSTAARTPQLGCFGMHEWAMVYRQSEEQTRHNAYPLRLGAQGTAAVVDEVTIRCSHFDAFRFFTESAKALNLGTPTRASQVADEQPGCLHANMDLYKWAYKLAPLPSAELVADCFALARDIRTLDMQASPYDLASLGVAPVRIETADGRAEYVRRQRDFAARAGVLRGQLIDASARILDALAAAATD